MNVVNSLIKTQPTYRSTSQTEGTKSAYCLCPIAEHSLNLVGNVAAACCKKSTSFYEFVQRLYSFFAGSTHRWSVLTTALGPRLVGKRLIETRWSARRDAVHALFEGSNEVKKAHGHLAEDMKQPAETQLEASKHCNTMNKLETAILACLLA